MRPSLRTVLLVLVACRAMAADAAPAAAAAKPYPFDTCIVSGESLGEMGDPVVFASEGREVKLCCKNCRKKFDARADAYRAIIDEGIAAKARGDQPVNPAAAPKLAEPKDAEGGRPADAPAPATPPAK